MSRDTLQDLRCEPRLPAEGLIILSIDGQTITGRLMDVSRSGFRATHSCPELQSGTSVKFQHPSGSGHAKVVWNRISGTSIESGFLILA